MSHDSDHDSFISIAGGVPLPPSPPSPPPDPPSKPKKPPLTHFLSLPLHHTPSLQSSIDVLAHDLSHTFPQLQIPPGALRPAQCFHLTLGVMSLTTPELVSRAASVLETTDLRALLGAESLHISLRGLATMGTPRKASVLYTIPRDATQRLQVFAEGVRQRFVDAGLVVDEKRELKLHATVLNTVYAKKGGRKSKGRPMVLDVREVVEQWGESRCFVDDLEIERVAICKMGARDLDGVKHARGYEEVARKLI